MKRTTPTPTSGRLCRRAWPVSLIGAALLASNGLSAQFQDEESFAFELSPFEVSATENIGYRATDTLAGIRIRTDLREVGSAISVVTSQFLQDTGSTTSQDLLQYTVGTEVGGLGGNFSGVVTTSGDLNDSGARQNPQNATRVRGLVSADNTRNFYLTSIPWDSYNTSRIDIQRGPNSILFGQGSGGGIVNADIQAATFGSNNGLLEFRVGRFGSVRGSLNVNRDIIANELAIRVALLDSETKYRQDPTYNHDRRAYVAARWEPDFLRHNDMRTRLNANFEKGYIRANRPRTATMIDHITPLFRTSPEQMVAPDGTVLGTIQPLRARGGFDPYVLTIENEDLFNEYPNRPDIGAARPTVNAEPWLRPSAGEDFGGLINNGFWAVFSDPNSPEMDYFRAADPSVSNGFSPTGGTPAGLRGPNLRYLSTLAGYAAEQNFLYSAQGLYRDPMISDPEIFDFYNILVDGNNKREWNDFKAYNITLEQMFMGDRVGFQFAYDNQDYSSGRNEYIGGTPRLMVDLLTHLPMAPTNEAGDLVPLPNPNFGRPMVIANAGGTNQQWTERETFRFTPFVELDFAQFINRDGWLTRILGRHQITGLLERNEIYNENLDWQRYALSTQSTAAVGGDTNLGIAAGQRGIRTVNYLGSSVLNATSPADLNLSGIGAQRNIGTNTAWYFNSNYLASAPATGTTWAGPELGLLPSNRTGTATLPVFQRNQGNNPVNYVGWNQPGEITVWNGDNANDLDNLIRTSQASRDIVESWAIVDQWRLLDEHLILLGGLRKDRVIEYRGSRDRINNAGQLNNNGHIDMNQPLELELNSDSRSDLLKTYSIVLRSPDFINRHLPWNMNATVFYSESENFRPESRVGLLGSPLSPPRADTEEYGFTLEAFDGRVMVRVNRFETNVLGATLNDNIDFNFPGRTADEVARSAEMALRVLTLDRSSTTSLTDNSGYRYLNPADETDERRYAYQPGPAFGNEENWTTADMEAADALGRRQAMAALASLDNDTARQYMESWSIEDPNAYYARWQADPDGAGLYNAGWQGLQGFAMTGDTVSRGTEVEIFLRPTDNWNVSINVAKVEAMRLNLSGEIADWVEDRWELYQNPEGPGGLRWFSGSQNAEISDTGLARMGRNAYWRYSIFRAQEGNNTPELRPWRFNIVTTYRFDEGVFDGFFVGGGYRWQDSNVIGYQATQIGEAMTTLPDGSNVMQPVGAFDVNKPYKGSSEDAIDLWFGYNRTLYRDRIDWRLQLNLRNVGDNARLIPATTNPDGSIAAFRIAEGMTWELTSSFSF